MPRRVVKDNLLELCEVTLQAFGAPVHYKSLTDVLMSSGAWAGRGKEPDQILYSALHNDVRRRGDDSAFRFLGNGVFCASTVKGVDLIAIRREQIRCNRSPQPTGPARRRAGETDAQVARRVEWAAEEPRCGNCRWMEFSGPYALNRRRGLCGQWRTSGKVGRSTADPPCEAHSPRSTKQREADRAHAEAIVAAVEKANKETKGAKRGS